MSSFVRDLPLFELAPKLRVPAVSLGRWPTPITEAPALKRAAGLAGDVYIKRDDLSSPIYGGNKVRCLELLFGEALEEGATHIEATGAFGTNHGVATALHAPRVGLHVGATLFPQPLSRTAAANLRVLGGRCESFSIPHWSALPAGELVRRARLWRRGESVYWMVPGGATPRGALAYVSAAFELVAQIRAGDVPMPRVVVVGVGSTCTAAGLLCGLVLAARRSLLPAVPKLIGVRVTPWPVTSKMRIVHLAHRASRELSARTGDSRFTCSHAELRGHFEVDGAQLGRGYGLATRAGHKAIRLFGAHAELELDTTYSAKVAASALLQARKPGPLVFWSTKSTAPLPDSQGTLLTDAAKRWLRRAEILQE